MLWSLTLERREKDSCQNSLRLSVYIYHYWYYYWYYYLVLLLVLLFGIIIGIMVELPLGLRLALLPAPGAVALVQWPTAGTQLPRRQHRGRTPGTL
jgi:hypothetical protein